MPRVHCEHCNIGYIKVPFAVQSLTFRCPRCNQLTCTVTEWERRHRETPPTERPRLPVLVEEVDDSFAGVERIKPSSSGIPPRESETPAPQPPKSYETMLTSPHPCTQCGHGIRTPLGCDRATVVCPACGNRTSLYAVLFRCACGAMLEAPTGREGQADPCPACTQPIRVPADVLQIAPTEPPLDAWFQFECAECLHAVTARREDAGVWAACPHCQSSLEVPRLGEALGDPAAVAEVNPAEVLHTGSLMRCPACATRISTRAEHCHICGRENR